MSNVFYCIIDCTLPNCAECEESDQNDMGKCTKCAGVFVLYQGTCNDNGKLLNKYCMYVRVALTEDLEMFCASNCKLASQLRVASHIFQQK